MTTRKYRAGIACLMNACGVRRPHIIALMGNPRRLYQVLRLLGFGWSTKVQDWEWRAK
jgi:hypothetical protein